MKLKEAARKIQRDSDKAYICRVNWSFMDERIQVEYDKVVLDNNSSRILGDIYIQKGKDRNKKEYSKFTSSQYINSTHIFTGRRFLGLAVNTSKNPSITKLNLATEGNAQLWYSQSPSGEVLVFIGPYQSDCGEFLEKEIIIGKYKNPSEVREKSINKHFSIFFKYCVCTSQHSASSLSSYLYRQYLIYNDFRYKIENKQRLIKLIERIVTLGLGGLAVWASLYAGGKI